MNIYIQLERTRSLQLTSTPPSSSLSITCNLALSETTMDRIYRVDPVFDLPTLPLLIPKMIIISSIHAKAYSHP
jgi:hypothetical protein